MKYYRQVVLRSGTTETTVWIEEYGAKIGNKIVLENDDRTWEVMFVSSTKRSQEDVDANNQHVRDFRNKGSLANT